MIVIIKDKLQFFYHSGSGNTFLVVQKMVEVFKKNGVEVNLYKIEDTNPEKIDSKIPIGIAFPVAFQATHPFIWDFIKNMPEVNGTTIFMVDTMMAYSGAIVGPTKRILDKKGYKCIGAKEIIMPNDFLPKNVNKDKNKKKVEKGILEAEKYAIDILEGKTKWKRIPLLSDFFNFLVYNKFVMNNINLSMGKRINVDLNKCVNCGLCANLCPVNNIKMNNKTPIFGNDCELCTRCLNFCPSNAIKISNKSFKQYKAVNPDKLMKGE